DGRGAPRRDGALPGARVRGAARRPRARAGGRRARRGRRVPAPDRARGRRPRPPRARVRPAPRRHARRAHRRAQAHLDALGAPSPRARARRDRGARAPRRRARVPARVPHDGSAPARGRGPVPRDGLHAPVRHRDRPRGDRPARVREVVGGRAVSTVSLPQDESRQLAPPSGRHPADPHGRPGVEDALPLESLRIVPARHPGRWAATAVVAVLLAMVVSSLVTNDRWEWDVVATYLTWPSVLEGAWATIRLTLVASVVGFALGTVLALMRLSRSPLLQSVSWTYTWVFRSVPLLLQLLLWYNLAYLYPHLSLGIPFGPEFVWFDTLSVIDKFWAAILGLGLSQAAYS